MQRLGLEPDIHRDKVGANTTTPFLHLLWFSTKAMFYIYCRCTVVVFSDSIRVTDSNSNVIRNLVRIFVSVRRRWEFLCAFDLHLCNFRPLSIARKIIILTHYRSCYFKFKPGRRNNLNRSVNYERGSESGFVVIVVLLNIFNHVNPSSPFLLARLRHTVCGQPCPKNGWAEKDPQNNMRASPWVSLQLQCEPLLLLLRI